MRSVAVVQGNRWNAIALPLCGAHCRWKTGLCTEVALDGLHLVIFKPEILDVAERFAVFSATKVHNKRFLASSKYTQQVKPLDKINLRLPALRFKRTLTDVVVTGCARKCEVVRQQEVDRKPVLLLPCRIPFADGLFILGTQRCFWTRADTFWDARRCSQCVRSRPKYRPARHGCFSHDVDLTVLSTKQQDVSV